MECHHFIALRVVGKLTLLLHPRHRLVQGAVKELRRGGLSRGKSIELLVDSPSEIIGPELAVPLGLLVTEAITNAYKHAFVDRTGGTIRVEVRRESPQSLLIRIQDNGAGFDPQGASASEIPGLGRSLIEAFVRQLHGELKIASQDGTLVEVRFPAPEQKLSEQKLNEQRVNEQKRSA